MNVGFIGFGNMAQALAAGFIRTQALTPAQIGACARNFEKLESNTLPHGFRPFVDARTLIQWADTIVIAVKPHQVEAVLAPVRSQLGGKIVVSVVAGFAFEQYKQILKADIHHISTIPNTPVAVGEGIIVSERTHSLTADQYGAFEQLFGRVGMIQPVDTPLLGIAGTICGCAPAFVYMFNEALADAAVKHGIARADAYRMAAQMTAGAGRLQAETDVHPAILKDAVCSPGGTTIVGVAALEREKFRGAVISAIDAIQSKK